MGKYTRGLLAVMLAVVLVLPAAAFAMLPEANARSSTGMDGPEATKVVDHDTSNHWKFWAGGYGGSKVTTQNVGRIWMDKTVQVIDDGKSDFLTTLSAMSSTSDTTSLVSKPLDIVMVLDASGSMDDSMGGGDSTKRIVALKNAANHFIDTIAEQNKNVEDASKQHQVAILKFAGKKSDKVGNDTYRSDRNTYNYSQTMQKLTACSGDGAMSLKNTVNSIEPAGSTRADYGMDLAKGIAGREDAQKIVVFFTDGSPTSSNGFEAEVAKDAINIAKTIKSGGATIYTIGIFNGAKPGDDPTSSRTSNENKFMHAVSSNYPDATSSVSHGLFGTEEWNVNFGNPVAGASYYKSATNAAELDQVFKDISSAITSGKGFPTKVEGNNPNGSGYITFEDELGAFMQVDSFTGAEYNGKTYGAATKSTDGNIDTYTFDGELAHLVITVDRADEQNPQRGDIVTVKIPASLIPLRRFTVDESAGTFVVDSTDAISPIRVAYASSVKAIARKNLFTPNNVPGLQDYINEHKDADSNTVSFYANKWTGDDAGDTVASFEPAATNSYYYFQKLTPVYTDAACTKLATEKPSGSKTYWYKDEFMAQNSSGAPYDDSVSIPIKGSELESFEGALVKDGDHWSIKAGTARLAFINQLHTTKERVGGNPTDTARDVINPQWNNTKVVSGATKVNVYLGNNGKISFTLNTTPTTLATADFGLTKVLEGRDWTDEDKFEFGLTSENSAPMPASKTATATKGHADISFGEIAYDKPGTYVYKVSEKYAGTTVHGIAYSKNVAEFTVTVKPNAKGELEASVKKTSGEAEFKNTYTTNPAESSVTDQITVTKVLTGRDLTAGEFSFELREVKGEDSELIETVVNAVDGKVTFKPIKYTEIGQHTYTLHEVEGDAGGIAYDNTVYTIVTTIADNGKGQLVATHELEGAEDVKSIEFKNTYSVTPLYTELDFGLSKAIDGRDWTDADKFSFTITAPEGTPLPDPATVTVSKKDAEDGIAAIKFGKIHYTAAGTYKYEIRENAGSAAGMTYDAHVATAEVTVTENGDGTLTANVTTENGSFTNTYRTELNYTAAGGLKLSKTLSGRPMTEGQFTFTVTPADEASAIALGLHEGANVYKSPATAEATVGLIDILAGHEVKFKQADAGKTFTYTVAEKNDGQPGYTYDEAVRTVTIAIADDGAGTLTATTTVSGGPKGTPVTVYKSGENKVESAVVPFANSYSATTDAHGGAVAQVVATKTLTGRPLANGEFYFGIAYAGETEAIDGAVATNINGQVSFGALHYTTEMLADLVSAGRAIRTDTDAKLAWTINYTAFEYTSPLAAKGITAAKSSFSFKVIVVDNGDGTLTAKPDYGGVEPVFENVYGADAVDAALAGAKKLQAAEGLTPADITGKFTFTVTADEAGAPMPERTTATNDAAGNVDFGKIHFTLEDLNRALGVTDDATDKAEADEADEAEADEAEAEEADVDADANADEPGGESEPAAPTAPRSHTFTYTVTESGSTPGVTNDANATRKVSYTVTDDGAGHLKVVREGDDGAAFTFTNTYSVTPTDSVVTDQVKTVKRLTGRDLAAGEFTFELLEDGVVVATGTNDANGTVALSPIRYEAPGVHTYMLREACPNALGLYKGVTYDGTTYTVVTTVSDNGDGTLTATHKLEGTTESAGFTNKYHAMPTQVSIGAIKVLEGRELKKDEFSFKLVGEDIESTVTNDADGKINFDKFEYDEPGTYVYTISEVKGDEAGMTYDKSVFTATVNVADDGEGNLKANVAFTKGDKSVEGIVFNNTYKKPETPVPTPDPGTPKTVTNIVKTVKGFLPTTGDQQTAALLMAFVIAIAGFGALVWGIRKR